MIELLQAMLLGIVEGLTEFLPISSTGHLIVTEKLIGFRDSNAVFTVVIQFGAIAAVIWYFRKDLWAKTLGLLRGDKQAIAFWKLLVIATIPAGIAGLALDNYMEKFVNPAVIGTALIIGGIILILIERHRPIARKAEVELDSVTTKQALIVGLSQCIALIPGVSRSGATIVGGLQAGMKRPTAAAFAFYISIPVMVLASSYKLVKHSDEISTISGGLPALLVGLVFAFITALLAVSWLLKYIAKHNFVTFGYYRIVAGLVVILFVR